MNYMIEQFGAITVYWTPELDGGGRSFGQQFVPVVRAVTGRVQRLFEFCAGAGFIGFSLLANGLCESLCLSDVNPDAVKAARKTVKENGLEDKVTVYLSDGLSEIPDFERWDLVVGNPPHFCVASEGEYRRDIIKFDPGWRIHRRFYREVHRFLRPHGSVIMLENYSGSDEAVFAPFLKLGNLELVRSFMYGDGKGGISPHYFLWSRLVCDRIISQEMVSRVVRVVVSEMSEKVIGRQFDRFEKVQLEVINDTGREVEIALQTRPQGPDLIIRVPPGVRKTSGTLLVPEGPLYIMELSNRPGKMCAWCES